MTLGIEFDDYGLRIELDCGFYLVMDGDRMIASQSEYSQALRLYNEAKERRERTS